MPFHREALEKIEDLVALLDYRIKIHTIFRLTYELAIHPELVDRFEVILDPDILLRCQLNH